MAASACLDGEYGLKDIYIGIPCSIGKLGIERIEEMELSDLEKKALQASAQSIRNSIQILK
jgi:malate dehydrogenase